MAPRGRSAIPITRAVKRDNVTFPRTGEVEHPAQIAIFGGDDITVEKDYWPPATFLEVVKPSTVDGDKLPARWMLPLYFSCSIGVPQSRASHDSGRRSGQNRAISRPLCRRRRLVTASSLCQAIRRARWPTAS